MWYVFYFYNFAVSFVFSLILTYCATLIARKWRIYDVPGERKIHKAAVPVLGWVGIVGSVLLTFLLNMCILAYLEDNPRALSGLCCDIERHVPGFYRKVPQLLAVLGGGVFIALCGYYDDKMRLSPPAKLLAQIAGALMLVAADIRITFFIPNYALSVVVTVVWVVAVVNAFNLLDNMDGLSAGIACISSVLFFCAVASLRQYFVSSFLAVFIGAVTGFLVFNRHPARIFMGDGGSMFIGYMIAALTVAATFYTRNAPTHFAAIMPLVILAVPLYDTLSVIVIRVKRKKPIYVGDANHFSHRLVALGMTQRGAVLFMYLVCFCAGVSALYLTHLHLVGALLVIAQTVSLLAVIAFLEYYAKKRQSDASANRSTY
jgi:UDP-GlcNAc:undecaprenyl-phosphate GlcNAc-1-phosphate transferase